MFIVVAVVEAVVGVVVEAVVVGVGVGAVVLAVVGGCFVVVNGRVVVVIVADSKVFLVDTGITVVEF